MVGIQWCINDAPVPSIDLPGISLYLLRVFYLACVRPSSGRSLYRHSVTWVEDPFVDSTVSDYHVSQTL